MNMTGWKTKAGGIGLILSGAGSVIGGFVADPMNGDMIIAGIGLIGAGFAALGIGHKIEKASS